MRERIFLRVCLVGEKAARARCRLARAAPLYLRAVGETHAAQAAPRRDAMSLREGERALQRFHEWCAKEGVEYDREVRPESVVPARASSVASSVGGGAGA